MTGLVDEPLRLTRSLASCRAATRRRGRCLRSLAVGSAPAPCRSRPPSPLMVSPVVPTFRPPELVGDAAASRSLARASEEGTLGVAEGGCHAHQDRKSVV